MKIRAITVGGDPTKSPRKSLHSERIAALGRFAEKLRAECETIGIPVQTVRFATPPLPQYVSNKGEAEVFRFVHELEDCCQAHGLEYCSIGPVHPQRETERTLFACLPQLIAETETVFASAVLAEAGRSPELTTAESIAGTMQEIAAVTPEGFGNLRFAAVINCAPHTPFFPAAFHAGEASFSLALEGADIVAAAADRVANKGERIEEFRQSLSQELERQLLPLQALAQRLSSKECAFRGLDLSPAPGPTPEDSIVYAIERLGLGRFGEPGTLAVAAQITAALKGTSLQTCGYCGLMLPVLEDVGLAERNNQGLVRLSTLLTYSAVCGTGLDTIPLAGDVSRDALSRLLLDVSSLGWKLGKPLSARLLPIPGKNAGDMTAFDFAYFTNTKIMTVD